MGADCRVYVLVSLKKSVIPKCALLWRYECRVLLPNSLKKSFPLAFFFSTFDLWKNWSRNELKKRPDGLKTPIHYPWGQDKDFSGTKKSRGLSGEPSTPKILPSLVLPTWKSRINRRRVSGLQNSSKNKQEKKTPTLFLNF